MSICGDNSLSKLNNAESESSLDVKYYLEREYEKAFSCFYRAALSGDVSAMWHLALMYNYGLGVNENIDKTIFWFKKAIEEQRGLSGSSKDRDSEKINEENKINYVNQLALDFQMFCE